MKTEMIGVVSNRCTSAGRIEYIDLMKGVCIIMVVLEHCKLSFPQGSIVWSMFEHMRMPLYFFLSGLFFKEYSCFKDYFVRKTNKLLIPYLFFSIIYFIPDILFIHSKHPGRLLNLSYFNDLILLPLNNPLWFLRCLFFTGCIYFGLNKLFKRINLIHQIIILLVLSYLAISIYDYNLPNIKKDKIFQFFATTKLFSAFVALPFFWIGNKLYSPILRFDKNNKIVFGILLLNIVLSALLCRGAVDFNNMLFANNFFFLYLGGLSGILAVWSFSFLLKKVIVVSLFGRYSLIILGMHWATMNSLLKHGISNVYVLGALTLALMPMFIWLFKKYFPFFCAQKNFFEFKEGKLLFLKKHIGTHLIRKSA